jgi:putative flippase GtrA
MSGITPVLSNWRSWPRPLRFLIVGAINTIFGYAAYVFFLWVGLHYAAAVLFGTIAGVTFNYFSTGRMVFDHASFDALPRFVAVYCAVYAINVVCLALLVRTGMGAYLAGAILILPIACVSYVLTRTFVFRRSHGPD